jgi:hypothetical protein
MQQNNTFSFNRMYLLYKQAFIENKKELLIYIGGLSGGILLVTSFFILVLDTNMLAWPEKWRNDEYILVFMFMFVGLGILYNSMAFPCFRSKERSLTYLMLPASRPEKFIFEFANRLLFYIVGFPLLAWVLMNSLGYVIHGLEPGFVNYKFDLNPIFNKFQGWEKALAFFAGLLMFTIAFTGASHFQKKALIKTLLVLAVTLGVFFLYGLLLFKAFNLEMYRPIGDRITFISSQEEVIKSLCLAAIATNLILLTVSYFKLKEKEV